MSISDAGLASHYPWLSASCLPFNFLATSDLAGNLNAIDYTKLCLFLHDFLSTCSLISAESDIDHIKTQLQSCLVTPCRPLINEVICDTY